MGSIHVHEFMSLDGVVDEPTWTFDYGFDPKMGEVLGAVTGRCKGILLGRETFEMFGVIFEGHPHLVPLLLPDGFEGHPLRKDFVLAARVAKAWPGAKEPGESDHGSPSRRKTLPPGVPADWGRDG